MNQVLPPPDNLANINKKPSILLRFWYWLTLKVYYDKLLTKGVASYLTIISVLVFMAAFAEGFAWGHLGSTFTHDNPWLGRIGLGCFVGFALLFFDRQMITADFLEDKHKDSYYHIFTILKSLKRLLVLWVRCRVFGII